MDNPIPHDEVQNTFFDGETPKLWWKNSESEQILNRGYLLKGETVEGAIDRITAAAATNHSP